jgi:S-adenosyl-L-methionine hydrolase (adenosine-forming)
METRVIGLMTDWGRDDGAYGSCQGVIWGINPNVQIADMSQEVESWDIKQGAFLLMSHYSAYPKGTIFVAVIDPGVGTKRKAIVVETFSGYYFVGPDNGVLSWALRKEKIKQVVNVVNRDYFREPVSAVFEGRDIFCSVAAHISSGVKLVKLGKTFDFSDMVWEEYPLKEKGDLIGEVLFIDKFGNLITSIERDRMKQFLGTKSRSFLQVLKPFEIRIGNEAITKLSHTYVDGKGGELIALFGGDFGDLLDIALCKDSASEKLRVRVGDPVIVKRR